MRTVCSEPCPNRRSGGPLPARSPPPQSPRPSRRRRRPTTRRRPPTRRSRSRRVTRARSSTPPRRPSLRSRRPPARSRRSTPPPRCTTSRPPTRSSPGRSAGARRPCWRGPPTAPPTRFATAIRRRRRSRAPRARTSASTWVNAPGFEDSPNLADANGLADGDGTPDYVESLLAIAEYSYSVEVAPGAMGWAPPKPDKVGCGADPSAHSDIYLKQLGDDGLFGYQTVDPGQGRKRSQYGYMVLDNDFSKAEFGYDGPRDPGQRHLRARVQPPAPGQLRHLPGHLDARVDRDLDRGEGLSGDQRLPRVRQRLREVPRQPDHQGLSAPEARVAADLRRRGLEPLARQRRWRLRLRRDPPRLGAL